MLLPKLYKISILYNFDELNDPTGRRAPVPAFTTFLTKSLTNATTCVKMVTAERTWEQLTTKELGCKPLGGKLFLFFCQLVSKRVQHRHGFVRMIQQPLHSLHVMVRMIILHRIDFARAVRRQVELYQLSVQSVQPRNSFEVFVLIVQNGYDIEENAEYIQDFYQKMLGNE